MSEQATAQPSAQARELTLRLRQARRTSREKMREADLLAYVAGLEGENDRLRTALRLIGAQAEMAVGMASDDGEDGR